MALSTWASVSIVSAESDGTEAPTALVFRGLEIDAQIFGSYASTLVTSVMENQLDEPFNHSFLFRIPEGAMISNFSLTVKGERFFADVLEKETAEEKFEEAVETGNTAAIVASRGDQLFAYGISFAPKEVITVSLRFEQILLRTNGWQHYELDLTSDPDQVNIERMSLSISVTSPQVIDKYTSEGYNDTLEKSMPSEHEISASMACRDFQPTENVDLRWRTSGGPLEGQMYFAERDGLGYFMHIFAPNPSMLEGGHLPKDFVFVLDKSGSMSGTKIDQSKEALDMIYEALREEDRFSLVEFESTSEVYSWDLLPASGNYLADVLTHITYIDAGGSTNIHAGVVDSLDIFKAAGNTVPVIVLLTDGKANVGLYARSDFRQDVLSRNTVDASIFCIAFGNGADWGFLEALALENDGRAIWVHEDEEVVDRISDFIDSFATPLLADLSFDYGPMVRDVYPATVRSHYLGSEVNIAGRFPIKMTEFEPKITATAPEGDVEFEATFRVDPTLMHDFVPRFWAFQRISTLEDQMKYNGTDNATVQEIVNLAIDFHFVTDNTSLFVELPEELRERFGSPDTFSPDISRGANSSLCCCCMAPQSALNTQPYDTSYRDGTSHPQSTVATVDQGSILNFHPGQPLIDGQGTRGNDPTPSVEDGDLLSEPGLEYKESMGASAHMGYEIMIILALVISISICSIMMLHYLERLFKTG